MRSSLVPFDMQRRLISVFLTSFEEILTGRHNKVQGRLNVSEHNSKKGLLLKNKNDGETLK